MRGIDGRSVPIDANGHPGVAAYARAVDGVYRAHTLQVFTVRGGAITHNTVFQDDGLFPFFGLPLHLPASRVRGPDPGPAPR
jgi:RNA polymerase sigma-70 factor (ECF subfamily)